MRADWDVDGMAGSGRVRALGPALGVIAFAAVCAIGASLFTLGGAKWEAVGLLAALTGMAMCAWLALYRRFLDASIVLLTLSVPTFIDVRVWEAHGWSYVPGWPQGVALKPSDIFLFIAAVGWFVDRTLLRGRPSEPLGWAGFWLALFVAAGVSFPFHSVTPMSSFIEWIELMRFAAIFVVIAKRLDKRSLLKWVVLGVALHVWVQGVICTLQYVTGSSLGLDFLGETAGVKTFYTEEGLNQRAGGLMGHPNNLALFLVLVGPLILAKTLTVRGLGAKVGWGATYVMLNVALLLTFSRFGWLCAVLSFFAVYYLIQTRAGQPLWLSLGLPLLASLVVFLVLFVGFESFRDRLLEDDRGSTESRFEQFKTAFAVIANWPLAGTGIGSYASGAIRFAAGQGRSAEAIYMRVHNGSLLVTAELGLLGGLGYHGWFFTVLRRGWAAWRYADHELATIGTGVFVGLVAWFLKSMYNAHTPLVDPAVWLFTALMIVIVRFAARDSAAAQSSRARPLQHPD